MRLFFLNAITMLLSQSLYAAPADSSTLKIEKARIFAPMKGTNVTGGFGKFTNLTDKELKIEVKDVPPFKAVEMHETVQKGDHMGMQKIEALSIPAKQSLELKPGSYHIMLFDPTREVKVDEVLKVTLMVNGQKQTFDFKVTQRMPSMGH